jgi:hypothetical protein
VTPTQQAATRVKEMLGSNWIPSIYNERILTSRTRSFKLSPIPKRANIEIQHTLLGVELKIGSRRISCPDLATARYLSVFARLNCNEVAVPYDISQMSQFADELESSWHRMHLLVETLLKEESQTSRSRLVKLLVNEITEEISKAGAGTKVPQFNQSTKQKKPGKAHSA